MKPLSPRIAILMTLPPLMWAGNAVVGRLMVGQMPPMALNALRWSLAALMLLPLAWPLLRDARERHAVRDAWPYLLLIGTLGIGAFNALQYLALRSSTALNVTLINASMPLWMLVVGALLWREHPARRALAGAALSLAGVATVVARGEWADLARVQFVIGDAYMLAAVIGWALYSWLLVRPPAWMFSGPVPPPRLGLDWAAFLFLQALFGLVGAGGASALELTLGSHAPIDWSSAKVLGALAFIAIGPSIVAYRCWGLGVTVAGPAIAAFFSNLSPLFAALLSALLLGQWPQPYHALAFALIVAGIAVSAWRR